MIARNAARIGRPQTGCRLNRPKVSAKAAPRTPRRLTARSTTSSTQRSRHAAALRARLSGRPAAVSSSSGAHRPGVPPRRTRRQIGDNPLVAEQDELGDLAPEGKKIRQQVLDPVDRLPPAGCRDSRARSPGWALPRAPRSASIPLPGAGDSTTGQPRERSRAGRSTSVPSALASSVEQTRTTRGIPSPARSAVSASDCFRACASMHCTSTAGGSLSSSRRTTASSSDCTNRPWMPGVSTIVRSAPAIAAVALRTSRVVRG